MVTRFLLLSLLSASLLAQPRMFKDPATGKSIQPYVQSWALIIAIDDYQNLQKLDYALSDASIIKDLLVRRFNVPESNLVMLTNQQATKQGIQNAVRSLASAGTEDNIVIFFVGHARTLNLPNGTPMGYLLPYESLSTTDELVQQTGISFQSLGEWLNGLRAKHILTLVNACVGGTGAIAPNFSPSVTLASAARARQLIVAGRDSERMLGRTEFGPTHFVFKIQEALERSPADSDGDGVVRASELASYLELGVQLMTMSRQTPQFFSFTLDEGDFLFLLPEKTELVPPPVRYGSIEVRSDPPGAEILLNGEQTGRTTPSLLARIPEGEHTVLLRRQEKLESRQVQVRADQTSTVRVTFPRDEPPPAVVHREPVRETYQPSYPQTAPLSPSWEFGGGLAFSNVEGIESGYQILARMTLAGDEESGFMLNFGYGSNPVTVPTFTAFGSPENITLTRTLTQLGWSMFLDFDPTSNFRTQMLLGMSYNVSTIEDAEGQGRVGAGAGFGFLIPFDQDFGMAIRLTYDILNLLGGEEGEDSEGFMVLSLSFVFGD
ncbi:MAG TPA: PEGA domain-containing protein [Bacteroidota bacterium]|nr:PEGA domain-containing protein [Bacteroidota bacterium]